MGKRRKYAEKKSEMLEVRISYSEKQALSALSQNRGESISETVRSLVSSELETAANRTQLNLKRIKNMTSLFSKHPRKALSFLVGGALSASVVLTAPSMAQDGLAVFAEMDTDESNTISLDEFLSSVRQDGLIWNPDADPDSPRQSVSLRELEGHTRSEFARYDRNRDGQVSRYEFTGRYVPLMRASFVALDRNVDEMISVDELATAFGSVGFDASNPPHSTAEQLVLDLDADGDLLLDFEEFMANS